MKKVTLLLIVLSISYINILGQKYEPTFESLEKVNPVPEWFKDAKFGIYFHWGVFSVPAFANEWYPRNMYFANTIENKHHTEIYGAIEEWPYSNFILGAKDKNGNWVQFAPKLTSEGGKFNPDEWAQLFADAGARFAGPVAEHHDGFSMWASKVNPWNSKDMGPKLDLVGLFTEAIRKKNMKIFLSMHHAYNITGYFSAVPKTNDPKLQILYGQQGKEKNEELWLNKHKEVIDLYQPDIIYQDFNLHLISQPVLLGFLSYYYNKAADWNKEVVATFKDGLNKNCAVLDYERGGPADITENYWLTDDAISSSSWCYTEGIGYYSKNQILHALIDRVSKNGNMILNISPKADGTIPQEQKDVLLAMGDWLKKYGEAIYSTRAWEQYGEGPTKMGAAHGVMGAPTLGTAQDIRFTRNKENTILYAISMGWDATQKSIKIKTLIPERINCKTLKSVELINGQAGKYLPLQFRQEADGLTIELPNISFDDMAYVFKISFEGQIPTLDKFVDLDCQPSYYFTPTDHQQTSVLGGQLMLSSNKKDIANQWKLEKTGKGLYIIRNRADLKKVISGNKTGNVSLSSFAGKNNQIWKFEKSYNGSLKITNKQFPEQVLTLAGNGGEKTKTVDQHQAPFQFWGLKEVCEIEQTAFKNHVIPGKIEAEDYNNGCIGDAYYDSDEANLGGQYRPYNGVDIESCATGGYNIGWTKTGEWVNYDVNVEKTADYLVTFCIASATEDAKIHLECDGKDISGIIPIINTGAYQKWDIVKKSIKLSAGKHQLKLFIDGDGVNLDKMIFETSN